MNPMIILQNISRWIGKEKLFDNITTTIRIKDRIGLVGKNGSGKTSLFKIIIGESEPDTGSISYPRYIRIGYLPQEWSPLRDAPLIDYVKNIHDELHIAKKRLDEITTAMNKASSPQEAEELAFQYAEVAERLEYLGGYDLQARAERVLTGLGFPPSTHHRPLSTLSGGWIMRAELARILLSDPDLILLDEPTNHLDLASLLWFESFIGESKAAFVIISHDREFLNRTVNRIWELDGGTFYEYVGNYDDYERQRAERIEHLKAMAKHQRDRIREIEDFIARNRVRKDRARQVQSRLKMLEKMELIELPDEEPSPTFSFPEPERAPKRLVELQNISKRFGNTILYENLSLTIERGDKVAFVGINGSGKTTLLKIIAGIIEPDSGTRFIAPGVKIGYYAQHQLEQLDAERTIFEEARSVSGDLPQSILRQILGAFKFSGDEVEKKVGCLSGGEKARLSLCKKILERPNLLLLDEPTNHLDIASREVLERALKEYAGTICFISHDRRFINALSTKILLFNGGRIELFLGNYDDLEKIWLPRLIDQEDQNKPILTSATESKKDHSHRKRLEAKWRNELYRLKKPLLEEVTSLEKEIEHLTTELDRIQALLSQPETYKNGGEKARELKISYHNIQERVKMLTSLWEERMLSLEELEKRFWKERKGSIEK
ncbi:MAG: ABC-F family ATP-binding cassette domain-containing protein [Syntrophobacterales bacterium]|nr:ABC-F family ATP-binding cassette domain-containing protein [Syntrophobacterales bacterium]